jgi:hypothetical protein
MKAPPPGLSFMDKVSMDPGDLMGCEFNAIRTCITMAASVRPKAADRCEACGNGPSKSNGTLCANWCLVKGRQAASAPQKEQALKREGDALRQQAPEQSRAGAGMYDQAAVTKEFRSSKHGQECGVNGHRGAGTILFVHPPPHSLSCCPVLAGFQKQPSAFGDTASCPSTTALVSSPCSTQVAPTSHWKTQQKQLLSELQSKMKQLETARIQLTWAKTQAAALKSTLASTLTSNKSTVAQLRSRIGKLVPREKSLATGMYLIYHRGTCISI